MIRGGLTFNGFPTDTHYESHQGLRTRSCKENALFRLVRSGQTMVILAGCCGGSRVWWSSDCAGFPQPLTNEQHGFRGIDLKGVISIDQAIT